MDGIHDIGGCEGFGPIPIDADERPFHSDWEERVWAFSRAGIAEGITIDWFRHGLERMVPEDYLAYPYFAKWCANYLMLLIDNGALTREEVLSGKVQTPSDPAPAITVEDALSLTCAAVRSYQVEIQAPPRFAPGDRVTTRRHIDARHTRLPQYARGASGIVTAHHGAHIFPDASAEGRKLGQHLYTVEFSAAELWGDNRPPRDTVLLDLWESYFAQG